MKRKISTLDLLDKLAKEEAAFLNAEFLAPKFQRQQVCVKIGQVLCHLDIRPRAFVGWGVFKPLNFRVARFVREATEMEKEKYLSMLPAIRMLIAGRDDNGFMAVRAYTSDSRFGLLTTPSRLHFAEGLEIFDCVVARFDGSQFLFDSHDTNRPASLAENLRECLANLVSVDNITGLLPEERWLYGEVTRAVKEAAERDRRNTTEFRLADALAHAGAVMQSYMERSDGYTVEYAINGERHTSFVDKNLRVRSAGICLSGRDADYDLASLVSVIKEGQDRRAIHITGIDDNDYGEWGDDE